MSKDLCLWVLLQRQKLPIKIKELSEQPGPYICASGNNTAKLEMAFCPIPQPQQKSKAFQHKNQHQRNSVRGHVQETSEDKLIN